MSGEWGGSGHGCNRGGCALEPACEHEERGAHSSRGKRRGAAAWTLHVASCSHGGSSLLLAKQEPQCLHVRATCFSHVFAGPGGATAHAHLLTMPPGRRAEGQLMCTMALSHFFYCVSCILDPSNAMQSEVVRSRASEAWLTEGTDDALTPSNAHCPIASLCRLVGFLVPEASCFGSRAFNFRSRPLPNS